jgi:hypothetical protein
MQKTASVEVADTATNAINPHLKDQVRSAPGQREQLYVGGDGERSEAKDPGTRSPVQL